MPGWALIVLAIAVATPPTIYRCPGDDGETMFSDRPCIGGRPQTMRSVITLDISKLSADEQATLERLNHPAKRSPDAAPAFRTQTKSQDERRCQAARDGLDQVQAIKRRGYRASSAARLDARQRRYEAQRDRVCSTHERAVD